MSVVTRPNCGLPMRRAAVAEILPGGKKIVIYTCPNQAMCRTILRQAE